MKSYAEWRSSNPGGTVREYTAWAYGRGRLRNRIQEELDQITATLPGTVYRSEDGDEAVFLHSDGTCVITVSEAATAGQVAVSSAYLISTPVEDLPGIPGTLPDADLEKIKGFSSGWDC